MATNQVDEQAGSGALVGCVGLALLGAVWWVAFARSFASSMGTSCGENCTTQTYPQVSLGIYLGLAVASTVFSAALLVVGLLRRRI